jgi:2-polyprenyl-3-methyl-5-hydroxy-6-metoxy-1,4-benzoquinol methylase
MFKMFGRIGKAILRGPCALARRVVGFPQIRSEIEQVRNEMRCLGARVDQAFGQNADQAERTRQLIFEQCQLVVDECKKLPGELNLDKWRINEFEGLLRWMRRKDYLEAIATGRLEIPRLITDHPIAIASNDTIHPRGCKNDNSICLRFNQALYRAFPDRARLRVLDLGCAGGGLVRSLIDDGHLAVGLEGSDYPKINQTGEWATISQHLHTCDITQPFQITAAGSNEPIRFDAITAWELMEHIPEPSLPQLLKNIDNHLAPGGRLLFSIATFLDWDERTGVIWHVTVKPREWWIEQFRAAGFDVEPEHRFGKNDWVRGSGHSRGDWHEDQGLGFHVVLKRISDIAQQSSLRLAA